MIWYTRTQLRKSAPQTRGSTAAGYYDLTVRNVRPANTGSIHSDKKEAASQEVRPADAGVHPLSRQFSESPVSPPPIPLQKKELSSTFLS